MVAVLRRSGRQAQYCVHGRIAGRHPRQAVGEDVRLCLAGGGPGERLRCERREPGPAQDDPRRRSRPDRTGAADRVVRGGQRRRRFCRRRAGRNPLLQRVGSRGARQGRACAAHHHGAVRAAGAVHRPHARPDPARASLHPHRHGSRPRFAVLGHGRCRPAQRHAHAAAGRVRGPAAAEGLQRDQGIGYSPATAARDHPGHRQLAMRARVAARNDGRRPGRRRDRCPGRWSRRRCGVGAARRYRRVPAGHDPGIPAAERGRRTGSRRDAGTRLTR